MTFKCSYSDFVELAQFMEKKAKGSSMFMEINLEGHLVIKTTDMFSDQVNIVIFQEDINYQPRITKTYRLTEEILKGK